MVTALYTAIMAVMLLGFTYRVILLRIKHKVGLGDGGLSVLNKAIRVHGNFVEFVPFILLEMFLVEQSCPAWVLHAFGVTLVVSRLLHAYGLSRTEGGSPGRFIGSILTHVLLLAGAVLCALTYLGMIRPELSL